MPPTFAKPQKRPRPAKRTQTGKIVLRVDSSARLDSRVSATRAIADALCAKFAAEGANVVTRDLARSPPSLITEAWIEHAPLPRDDLYYELGDETTVEEKAEREAREMKRRELMEESDEYVEQLLSADVLVIGAPLYNFSVPASLKAWIDLVVRDKRTVRDTREGPIPLLKNKKAFVIFASGGAPVGTPGVDFNSDYVRAILGHVGITDVTLLHAAGTWRGERALQRALSMQVAHIDARATLRDIPENDVLPSNVRESAFARKRNVIESNEARMKENPPPKAMKTSGVGPGPGVGSPKKVALINLIQNQPPKNEIRLNLDCTETNVAIAPIIVGESASVNVTVADPTVVVLSDASRAKVMTMQASARREARSRGFEKTYGLGTLGTLGTLGGDGNAAGTRPEILAMQAAARAHLKQQQPQPPPTTE